MAETPRLTIESTTSCAVLAVPVSITTQEWSVTRTNESALPTSRKVIVSCEVPVSLLAMSEAPADEQAERSDVLAPAERARETNARASRLVRDLMSYAMPPSSSLFKRVHAPRWHV